jgi:ComF family protein
LRLGARTHAGINFLVATVFEPPCAACQQRLLHPLAGAVCEPCWLSLRLAPHLHEHYSSGHAIAWACAVDRYEGRMKDIVHALKYERRRSIAPPLGQLMKECGAELLRDADVAVPVPLHRRREYQRGFNQAEDLAAQLGLPVIKLLSRVRHTHSQIDLPKHQRQENVKNAFALNPVPLSPLPAPGIVVLVDDVSTTGATLEACARVLKSAGVKEVRALTAARVVNERR